MESASEPLILVPLTEVPIQQPSVDSQLGGLYITTMQVQNDGNVAVCSLDLEAQECLKKAF